jgi:ring-1,2-phenylacetyl-CoA epoxidase subunit PaaC
VTSEDPQRLAAWLVAVADDELILAHRNSEWAGHGPILEDDIALTNLALDEMGHAHLWYRLAAEVLGQDPERYPDRMVFQRTAGEYRSIQMVELPRGDWAFSLLRQFLFDAWEQVRLARWQNGPHRGIAQVAAKVAREERYHIRYSRAWVRRLGQGTAESHTRMQAALDQLWPGCRQLLAPPEGEPSLSGMGALPERAGMEDDWRGIVLEELSSCSLDVPSAASAAVPARSEHTPHLAALLAEMQSVARLDPEAAW